jgi:hypothetical protein
MFPFLCGVNLNLIRMLNATHTHTHNRQQQQQQPRRAPISIAMSKPKKRRRVKQPDKQRPTKVRGAVVESSGSVAPPQQPPCHNAQVDRAQTPIGEVLKEASLEDQTQSQEGKNTADACSSKENSTCEESTASNMASLASLLQSSVEVSNESSTCDEQTTSNMASRVEFNGSFAGAKESQKQQQLSGIEVELQRSIDANDQSVREGDKQKQQHSGPAEDNQSSGDVRGSSSVTEGESQNQQHSGVADELQSSVEANGSSSVTEEHSQKQQHSGVQIELQSSVEANGPSGGGEVKQTQPSGVEAADDIIQQQQRKQKARANKRARKELERKKLHCRSPCLRECHARRLEYLNKRKRLPSPVRGSALEALESLTKPDLLPQPVNNNPEDRPSRRQREGRRAVRSSVCRASHPPSISSSSAMDFPDVHDRIEVSLGNK